MSQVKNQNYRIKQKIHKILLKEGQKLRDINAKKIALEREYLQTWKNYLNKKTTRKKFMQVSSKLAKILEAHKKEDEILRAKYMPILRKHYKTKEK